MLSVSDFKAKQILFLVTKNGEKLSFQNDNVIIKDADNKIIHQSTCYRLFSIFVIGHISITSGLLQRAKKFSFSIVLMTPSFRVYQTISSFADANVLLRKKQYEFSDITASKRLIANKISNQRELLMETRNKSDEQKQAIALLDKYILSLDSADSLQSVMGYEGNASRIYFKALFDNYAWRGRKPRIKFDMVNALLDIGYTILFSYVDAVVGIFGFDKYCGILHTQFYMRKSLICDLVEPFRVIIDKQTKQSINLGQFQEKDFEIFDGKWVLKYKKSSAYAAVYLNEINKNKENIFIYVRNFYRAMMKNELSKRFPRWSIENGISQL